MYSIRRCGEDWGKGEVVVPETGVMVLWLWEERNYPGLEDKNILDSGKSGAEAEIINLS